jgi:isopentenyl phosphate kinase
VTIRTGTVYVKLGGALITDKAGREAIREEVLRRSAAEIATAWQEGGRMVVGHGSGSFGHAAAADEGYAGNLPPASAARVGAAARRLNAIVVDALIAEGLPALGFPGASLARAATRDGGGPVLLSGGEPVRAALAAGLLPVVYGDVVPAPHGGAICSTEAIFVALLAVLPATRVVLATDVDGFLDASGALVRSLAAGGAPESIAHGPGGREGVRDVTGGMATKVLAAQAMVRACPGLEVVILNGLEPGRIRDSLMGDDAVGTLIAAAQAGVAG